MVVNFNQLQTIFNKQIDLLLASTGLTTQCVFNFGTTKNNICPNCIFDVNLKKSSNKYKAGGPVPFALGKICPYCSGLGFYGEIKTKSAYLAILWDYKTWINPPTNISNPEGYIQTICDKTLLTDIRNCKDITVLYNSVGSNPVFELHAEPNPVGLGDNKYLICTWKKVGTSDNIAIVTPTPTRTMSLTSTPSQTPQPTILIPIESTPTPTFLWTETPVSTQTPTLSLSYGVTPTPTLSLSLSASNTPTPSLTYGATPTRTSTPTLSYGPTPTPTPSLTYGSTPTPTVTPSGPSIDACFSGWSDTENDYKSINFLSQNGYRLLTSAGIVDSDQLVDGLSRYVVTLTSRKKRSEFVLQIQDRLLEPPGYTILGSNEQLIQPNSYLTIIAPSINNSWKKIDGTYFIDYIIGKNIYLVCTPKNVTPTPTMSYGFLTPTVTPTISVTNTNSNSQTPTPSLTYGSTPTTTPTPSVTYGTTPTTTPSSTVTQTLTYSPTSTSTVTPSLTYGSTPTCTPTLSSGADPTQTPSNTPSLTYGATPTVTPTKSLTPTNTPTISVTNSISLTPTITQSNTPTLSYGATPTSTSTVTPSLSVSNSNTPTISVSNTVTPSISVSASKTPTPTPSLTYGATPTSTLTPSVTYGTTPTRTVTPTITSTATPTVSLYSTPTPTLTSSITATNTPTATKTPTPTLSQGAKPTQTPSMTPEPSCIICGSDPVNINICYGSYGSSGATCDGCSLLTKQLHKDSDPPNSWRWPDYFYGWGDFTGYVSNEHMLMLSNGDNTWTGNVLMVRKHCRCYRAVLKVECNDNYLSILEYKEICSQEIADICPVIGGDTHIGGGVTESSSSSSSSINIETVTVTHVVHTGFVDHNGNPMGQIILNDSCTEILSLPGWYSTNPDIEAFKECLGDTVPPTCFCSDTNTGGNSTYGNNIDPCFLTSFPDVIRKNQDNDHPIGTIAPTWECHIVGSTCSPDPEALFDGCFNKLPEMKVAPIGFPYSFGPLPWEQGDLSSSFAFTFDPDGINGDQWSTFTVTVSYLVTADPNYPVGCRYTIDVEATCALGICYRFSGFIPVPGAIGIDNLTQQLRSQIITIPLSGYYGCDPELCSVALYFGTIPLLTSYSDNQCTVLDNPPPPVPLPKPKPKPGPQPPNPQPPACCDNLLPDSFTCENKGFGVLEGPPVIMTMTRAPGTCTWTASGTFSCGAEYYYVMNYDCNTELWYFDGSNIPCCESVSTAILHPPMTEPPFFENSTVAQTLARLGNPGYIIYYPLCNCPGC